ncbi:flavodoxin family protein [Methanosphaerula palustris]|uniref:NADPH-dependent FMN reductase n=1 Tax=Methanosphaerula palustris (strain ATCC BAA-1556 / DSM 19958 / E1-9c) TaxID=521011 RepID=B8GJN6_METPE|nr:NAD(P)H-dependent oxidoreductase [Methanosphaerula palustris]ACL15690.1 NADPH-dependent FMN reductase [Methanosphaerula palustris E1-9c]
MEIKVLAFAASPRRHGNSETLLDWVIAAMEKKDGVVVEKVVLNEADVHPCKGCNACERLNRCVQDDGMTPLYDSIVDADVVIVALPIYCMGVCAQVKALIDRAQVFRSRKYVLHLPVIPVERVGKRVGLLIATAGQTWPYVFDGALPSVKCFFHVSAIRDPEMKYLLINGVDEAGAVKAHPTARTEAEAIADQTIALITERLSS